MAKIQKKKKIKLFFMILGTLTGSNVRKMFLKTYIYLHLLKIYFCFERCYL